jgi:hypothetical protein
VLAAVVVDSLIVEVVVLAVVAAVVEAQLVEVAQLLAQTVLVAVVAVRRIMSDLGIVIQHREDRALLLLLTQEHRDFQVVVFQQCQDQVIQSTPLHQVEH